MPNAPTAFQIKKDGRTLDYLHGKNLNFADVSRFLEQKNYHVVNLKNTGRHVVGVLEKNSKTYFLKLATSEGVSYFTQNEALWNKKFNIHVGRHESQFWIPYIEEEGYYQKNLFYMITDNFEGKFLAERGVKAAPNILKKNINLVIEFAELIQTLPLDELRNHEFVDEESHQHWFIRKTKTWYQSIPADITKKYKIDELLKIVESESFKLDRKSRHGDYAPWHLMLLANGKIGLIDGEHAMGNGVENYDICYFIQRVYSVMKDPEFAKEILDRLLMAGYDKNKLKTVLAARAIGGFLDANLLGFSDNFFAEKFKVFVLSL